MTDNLFLLLPDHRRQIPVPIGSREIALLNRIDGRRTLWAVLKKSHGAELKRALSFVWYLARSGAIGFDSEGRF